MNSFHVIISPFPPAHGSYHQSPPYSVPLGVAAQNGHAQTVEKLLNGGAKINHQDEVRCMCYTDNMCQI